jgi:hypothetical protein
MIGRLANWGRFIAMLAGLALVGMYASSLHAAQLSLTWSDASSNEDGFHIQRKTGTSGTYGTLAAVGAGTTGYVDGTITAGTTYCYRVSAYNSAGDSTYSNEACAAAATPTLYSVSVGKTGTGSGTVASSPSGINCGGTCSASFASGTSVALSATPAAGSAFTGWSGACTGAGTCAVIVDGAKSVTATFALQTYTLTVDKSGTGSGTVTSSPSGLNCGSICSGTYNYNTSVTLTAAAATGSTFTGWSGACTGTGTCTVTMSAARSVTATFDVSAPTTYAVTVSKSGTGSGTLTSSPTGINCGPTCIASFNAGTTVTLAAAPASGSTFSGWSGACTGTGTCSVSMTQARTVTASFTLQTYSLNITKSGTGTGTVTSTPGGISCGASCSTNFNSGSSVTLTAAAGVGSTFTGWSGACSGTGTCIVTMNGSQVVTAAFSVTPPPSTYVLNVTKNGLGTGIVASNPAGINCGTTCSASFASGALVTLEAMPDAGSTFTGWGGACSGAGSCTVTMSQTQNVTTTFAPQSVMLTVSDTGTGSGMVSSNPAGIACGTACSKAFSAGTAVTLDATPNKNSAFAGWSGACSGTGPCTVTLTQGKSVTATFKKKGRR